MCKTLNKLVDENMDRRVRDVARITEEILFDLQFNLQSDTVIAQEINGEVTTAKVRAELIKLLKEGK